MTEHPTPDRQRRLRDLALDALERHGDAYAREGIRLLKRLQLAVVLIGVAAVSTVALFALWMLR